jgi:hypothetical protein
VHHSPLGYTGANEGRSLALEVEHRRNRVPAALTYDDNNLALAVLIASETTVSALLLHVGGLHVTAEIAAINFGFFAFPADNAALQFLCHSFAELVQQHECGLIGQAQVAAGLTLVGQQLPRQFGV